jgi:TetR/AcrR family transcriptional regulator
MTAPTQAQLYDLILDLERKGTVSRTFRRLDPGRQAGIIQAILDEAGERGPADINIKNIAGRSGVSVGSLYQYFGSRDGLLDFAIELVVRTTVDLFQSYQPYLVEMPLREALAAYLSGGIEWSQAQAGFVRFFAAAAYRGDPEMGEKVVRPIAEVLRQMVEQMLARAIERGEIRPDIDLEAVASLINTLLIAMGDAQLIPTLNQYYQALTPSITPDRLMEALLDWIESGLSPERTL